MASPSESTQPMRPRQAITVAIVDGADADQVRDLLGPGGADVESHPRGALIAGDPGGADRECAEHLGATVYTVVHNPRRAELFCYVWRRGQPTQCFTTTPLANADLYEMIDTVLGASTPNQICAALALSPARIGLGP